MKEIYLIYRGKKIIYAVSTFEKALEHVAKLRYILNLDYHYEKIDYAG